MLETESRSAEKLNEIETRLRGLREEKARAVKVANVAKSAATQTDDDATLGTAKEAAEAVKQVQARIEAETERQVELLRTVGQPLSLAGVGGDGWATAARRINLAAGDLRVDVAAASLLAQAPIPANRPEPPPPALSGALGPPRSNRWLHPVLPVEPFSGAGDLVATDYEITATTAVSGVTGVEIPPATDTEKAVLPVDVALATPTAKVYAVVAENVPSRIFESESALQAFLGREMARHLSEAVDAATVSTIESAAPPAGQTGADLVAQICNAIADMRDLGGEPTVVALTPADAAALDLTEDGAGNYVFSVNVANGGDEHLRDLTTDGPTRLR